MWSGTHDDGDIRYLSPEEVEALCRAIPDDDLGRTERVLYRTAAMTGLRQGELVALRWRDVDWLAGRVRVRRSLVRGEFGTPKSRRASRAVPLAVALAAALDVHQRASAYAREDDLVFGHPHLGKPLDRSKLLKRYKAAVRRAGSARWPRGLHRPRRRVGRGVGVAVTPTDLLAHVLTHARAEGHARKLDAFTKWCRGCQRDLPSSALWRDPSKRDGLHTRCASCRRA